MHANRYFHHHQNFAASCYLNMHLSAGNRLGILKIQAIQPFRVDFDHYRSFNPNNYIKFADDNSDEI